MNVRFVSTAFDFIISNGSAEPQELTMKTRTVYAKEPSRKREGTE